LATEAGFLFSALFPFIDRLFRTYYKPALDEYPPTGLLAKRKPRWANQQGGRRSGRHAPKSGEAALECGGTAAALNTVLVAQRDRAGTQ
jgi:hypothetical protein